MLTIVDINRAIDTMPEHRLMLAVMEDAVLRRPARVCA